jgi:hypothetical protein
VPRSALLAAFDLPSLIDHHIRAQQTPANKLAMAPGVLCGPVGPLFGTRDEGNAMIARMTNTLAVWLLIGLGTLCLSAQAQQQEQAGNVMGVKQPEGSSLNIVPWLDFPATKTSARDEWRGAPDTPTLAAVLFDGKKVTFEDESFFMMMHSMRMDYQNSLCRSTLLKLTDEVQFPANTADITAKANQAWVRLIHGAVAGGANVKVVYAADQNKKEQPFEIEFPASESFDTVARLMQSQNANARQSGILSLRWCSLEKNRKDIVRYLTKGLQDRACGVRGASAWIAGQLHIKEVLSALSSALKVEKDKDVKKTIEEAMKAIK